MFQELVRPEGMRLGTALACQVSTEKEAPDSQEPRAFLRCEPLQTHVHLGHIAPALHTSHGRGYPFHPHLDGCTFTHFHPHPLADRARPSPVGILPRRRSEAGLKQGRSPENAARGTRIPPLWCTGVRFFGESWLKKLVEIFRAAIRANFPRLYYPRKLNLASQSLLRNYLDLHPCIFLSCLAHTAPEGQSHTCASHSGLSLGCDGGGDLLTRS